MRLPVQLQRAMAAEVIIDFQFHLKLFSNIYFLSFSAVQAEASREARAKVIASEGEQKASRALREASEIIGDSPAALQLRYLQVCFEKQKKKRAQMFLMMILFPILLFHLVSFRFVLPSSTLDIEHNLGREEFNNHFPPTHRHDDVLHEKVRIIENPHRHCENLC